MVHEVSSTDDFRQQLNSPNKLCVVDFTATWCGPCKMIAPVFESLSHKYPDVKFLKVVESQNQELIVQLGIRAFPTFRFYIGGRQVDEMSGANPSELEAKILQHRPQQSFTGEGMSLGGGAAVLTPEQARAARAARFNQSSAAPAPSIPSTSPSVLKNFKDEGEADDDAALLQAVAMSLSPQNPTKSSIDQGLLESLMDMGFPETRSRKALLRGKDLEAAISWLEEHENDVDIDDPIREDEIILKTGVDMGIDSTGAMDTERSGNSGNAQAHSLRCGDCGALLRDVVAAELHAAKTGHANFEESTEEIKPLSPEEKAAKIEALKLKLAARRVEREETEKQDNINREKQRRFMGKEMGKTKEELERQTRKREAMLARKEKEDEKAERERLKKMIEQDKRERAANKGKLSGKLGVEGYSPSVPLSGTPYGASSEGGSVTPQSAASETKEEGTVEERIDKAITTVSRYRTGGDGGVALQTLHAYCTNALKPDSKFRTINMDNNAFKTRVKPFVGGVALLKAVGFVKDEDENKLVLPEEAKDEELLNQTIAKLQRARDNYQF